MIQRLLLCFFIVIVSVIYGFPNIILSLKLGENYNPLPISGFSPIARDEAFAYAPEANFILKGNLFLKEMYVKEYQNTPTPFLGETAPSLVYAVLSKLTGSIEKAFIAGDFIFPPIIFVLLYLVARIYINNNFFALSAAFLTVIARDFIAVIPYPHETFQYLNFEEGQNYLLYFSRAFHPQLTFIFFSLAVLATVKMFQSPNKKFPIVLTGMLIGILFYSYIFYWTYFLFFSGLLVIYLIVSRNLFSTKRVVIAILIGLILGLPYFYNMFQFYKLDLASDFVAKTSLHNLRLPITLLRYLIISAIFFLSYPKKDQKFYLFFSLLMSGILIAPISKLVIGQDLETFHYLRRALMPFATIALFVSAYYLIKNKSPILKVLPVLIVAVVLYLGFKTQLIASNRIYLAHTRDYDREAVFSWLRSNTVKDSTVGSLNTTFNSLLPLYTQNWTFFPPTDRTVTPTAEGVRRYITLSKMLGIGKNWQKKNLDNIISYLFVYQAYDNQNRLDLNSPKRIWAESEIDKYSETNIAISDQLDYLVVTPEELEIIKPDTNILHPLTSINKYIIFRLRQS